MGIWDNSSIFRIFDNSGIFDFFGNFGIFDFFGNFGIEDARIDTLNIGNAGNVADIVKIVISVIISDSQILDMYVYLYLQVPIMPTSWCRPDEGGSMCVQHGRHL